METDPGQYRHGMDTMDATAEQRLVGIVARARVEGWYEDDPGWGEADGLLRQLGYDVPA